jgi:deoxyadenosine/deoxycytidine kinase
VQLLSRELSWEPFFEPEANNPYLADFYRDMPTWSFQSQIFFLAHRLRAHRAILDHPGSVLQDRSVYEDAEIFARNLYLQGLMDERDYRAYHDLFYMMVDFLRPPDLVVYLRAPVDVLLERIRTRSRDFEREIPRPYLAQLNERYEEWVARFDLCPVLTVDAGMLRLDRLDDLIAQMQARLPTIFPLVDGGAA